MSGMGNEDIYVSSWGWDQVPAADGEWRRWRLTLNNPNRDHSVPEDPPASVFFLTVPREMPIEEVMLHAISIQRGLFSV